MLMAISYITENVSLYAQMDTMIITVYALNAMDHVKHALVEHLTVVTVAL